MPWEGIAKHTDKELKAMFAYLKTIIKPIKISVPTYQPLTAARATK
jgi:hypothetical protein